MKNKLHSKLPDVETSIFTEMSVLANQYGAINLSQGFPEFDAPEPLKRAISQSIKGGQNQYAPSQGIPNLLAAIGALIQSTYAHQLSPQDNITVTSGATEALFVAIQSVVQQGDEVIVFDPAYDSYDPVVRLAGGKCIHIPLGVEDFGIDWDRVVASVTSKTRLIIINSPHNPSGAVLSQADMKRLEEIVLKNNLYLISDEVYEFITFDGVVHQSVHRFPDLFARSFIVSSFGKTFHCTGWKVGYCCAPLELTHEFRKIHQYTTFSSFTPAQFALEKILVDFPEHIKTLSSFYQEKRDYFIQQLKASRFKIRPTMGTYFVLVDYSQISDKSDKEFCRWLTIEKGVAAIPLSPFYENKSDNALIRFCFAKNEKTLESACNSLNTI